MSRMMRICSLNQNSHLLHPSLSALLFLALSIIFSNSLIAFFLSLFSFFVYSLCNLLFLSLSFLFFRFSLSLLVHWLKYMCWPSSLSIIFLTYLSLFFLSFFSLHSNLCHCSLSLYHLTSFTFFSTAFFFKIIICCFLFFPFCPCSFSVSFFLLLITFFIVH